MAEDNVTKIEGAVPAAPAVGAASPPAAQVQPPQTPAFDPATFKKEVVAELMGALQSNPDVGWMYGGTAPAPAADDNPFASFTTPPTQPTAPVQPPAGQPAGQPAPSGQTPPSDPVAARLERIEQALVNFGQQTEQKNAMAAFQSEVGRRVATNPTFAALPPEKQRQLYPRLMRIAQTIDIASEGRMEWDQIAKATFDEANSIVTAWNATAPATPQPAPGVPGMLVPPPRAVAGSAVPAPQKIEVKKGEWNREQMQRANEALLRGETTAT